MADPQPTDPAAKPKPKGVWGSILTATPIALTALATAFAGLSNSEMTDAMYHRTLAAQHQSRASDQWAFFQAKRIRGAGLEASLELFHGLGHPDPFDPARLDATLARMAELLGEAKDADAGKAAEAVKRARDRLAALRTTESATVVAYLTGPGLPPAESRSLSDPGAQAAYQEATRAIRERQMEADTVPLITKLSPAAIEEAARLAEEDATRFDEATRPVRKVLDELRAALRDLSAAVRPLRPAPGAEAGGPGARAVALYDRLDASVRAAALDFDARRYRREADLNQRAAEAYEVRVRRSGIESGRHRVKSERFFFSMLLAQVGATVSALALARTQRSLLWLLAAVTGLVALAFTGYVYLTD